MKNGQYRTFLPKKGAWHVESGDVDPAGQYQISPLIGVTKNYPVVINLSKIQNIFTSIQGVPKNTCLFQLLISFHIIGGIFHKHQEGWGVLVRSSCETTNFQKYGYQFQSQFGDLTIPIPVSNPKSFIFS